MNFQELSDVELEQVVGGCGHKGSEHHKHHKRHKHHEHHKHHKHHYGSPTDCTWSPSNKGKGTTYSSTLGGGS